MIDVKKIADKADVIINGYAFTKNTDFVKVLNLNEPDKAAVIDKNSEVIETSMSDIEIDIVMDYFRKNKRFLEV